MGSLLSSMPHNGRDSKKKKKSKRKNNKKKYPIKQTNSSSSSSFSTPSKSSHVRHNKLRHQRHTSSSSSDSEIVKGNVKNKTALYNQLDKGASPQTQQSSSKPKFAPKSKINKSPKHKSGFDYHYKPKQDRPNERVVTVELDIPELTQQSSSKPKFAPKSKIYKSPKHKSGFDYHYKPKQDRPNERIVTVELDIPELTKANRDVTPYHPSSSSPITYHNQQATKTTMPTKKEFEEACIKAHNEYRKCHNANGLERDTKLTSMAQEWANKLAKRGRLEHSNNRGFGENVAFTSKSDPSGLEIAKMWYDEIKDYNYRNPGFAGNTGHFTQVVWKGTTQVGIGIATGSKGTFVVANYKPAGNITNPGYFKENVDKQRKKPTFAESKRRSSSSSSSSSDDECHRPKASSSTKTSSSAPKPGKKVDTKTEIYTENGVRKKKTITTTTTVTVTAKGTQTSTETKTKIETLPDDNSVTGKLKNLRVRKDSSSSSSSSDDDDSKNVLSSSDQRKFRKDCLERHNELRKKHGAPKLKSSSSLQDKAQRHANKMLRQEKLSHTGKCEFGENVAMKMPMPSGSEACDMWYSEKKDYDFRKSVFSGNTGHFTQVVWEGTKEVGVGVASNSDGKTYVACFYNPPGNVRGDFEKNVKRG
uniref:uncharacterized protein LOC120340675 n=1 Tax=Styela clava TaxID=7725 RepID=UPI0019397B89|nr:uncharacterized protein LOC120340675 [Styela clava]